MVDWEKYYKFYEESPNVLSIRDTQSAYFQTLNYMHADPKTILLGGFASDFSLDDFEIFSKSYFPKAKTFALDINKHPLKKAILSAPNSLLLQADLNELPFKEGSIDLMLLDFTLNCMPPENIAGLFSSASRVISPNGIVVASVIDLPRTSRFIKFVRQFEMRKENTPYTYTPPAKVVEYASQFDLSYSVQMPHPNLLGPALTIMGLKKS